MTLTVTRKVSAETGITLNDQSLTEEGYSAGYVASSTALAAEYVQLGKYKRAFEVLSDAERRAKDHPITPRGRCAMLLQKANLESLTGSLESR